MAAHKAGIARIPKKHPQSIWHKPPLKPPTRWFFYAFIRDLYEQTIPSLRLILTK